MGGKGGRFTIHHSSRKWARFLRVPLLSWRFAERGFFRVTKTLLISGSIHVCLDLRLACEPSEGHGFGASCARSSFGDVHETERQITQKVRAPPEK